MNQTVTNQLTPELLADLLPLFSAGVDWPIGAAIALGVQPSTLESWIARGNFEIARCVTSPDAVPDPDLAMHVTLAQAAAEWSQLLEAEMSMVILRAALNGDAGSVAFLTRRCMAPWDQIRTAAEECDLDANASWTEVMNGITSLQNRDFSVLYARGVAGDEDARRAFVEKYARPWETIVEDVETRIGLGSLSW